ncbi:tetratricopeptide repeat protein [Scytonema sp. NUACC26]|uniref:tetratricopeptide repeat protein n=1 Tax=Scytonema sp. NUACC26 TaxID=3140176 RepID=UPI0034DBACC6
MEREEEILKIRGLIAVHQKNLYAIEEILATYGVDRPIHLLNSLTFEQEEIKKLHSRLNALELPAEQQRLNGKKCLQNLPRRPFFVGREQEIETILGSLDPTSRTFIVAIEGLGGVGKTSLAIEVAYQCVERDLFAAIVWVTAKELILTPSGVETQTPDIQALKDIFSTIGEVLNYSTIRNNPLEEQNKISYSLLSKQTTLLLIDNFETLSLSEREEIIAFLRKTPVTVKSIITSRERISEGHRIQLKGLLNEESKTLLEWVASQHANRLTNEQIDKIIKVTGGLPLAMLWVEAQVSTSGASVNQVIERLEFGSDLPILQFCFEKSWGLLETKAQQILIALALHIDPATRTALTYIVKVRESDECDSAITSILQLSLVIHNQELDRLCLHPLTRRFVLTKAKQNKAFVRKANQQMAQYYLDLVQKQGKFELWRDYDRLLLDRDNILAASQLCYRAMKQKNARTAKLLPAQRKQAEMMIAFAQAFGSVLWQCGFWLDRLSLTHAALEAAQLLEDWKSVGNFSRNITWIYFYQGDYIRAQRWAEASLQAMLQTGDDIQIATAKRALGTVVTHLSEFDRAKQLLLEAIEVYEQHNHDDYALYGLGFAQNDMGDLAYEMHDYDEAARWYETAIETWQSPERQDPNRHISIGLNGLGFVALRQGQFSEAEQFFHQSMDAAGESSIRQEEKARAKLGLAEIAIEQSAIEQAVMLAREALETFKQVGMQHEIHLAQQLIERFSHTQ